MPAAPAFWAVIGDVVRSRQAPDRAALQARLQSAIDGANRAPAPGLAAAWIVTLGDEFQALFRTPAGLPLAVEAICHGLAGDRLRFGIGHGPLATPLRPRAVGMDGPCFHRARAAVQAARHARRRVVVQTAAGVAQPVSDVWDLAAAVIGARTPRQAELVAAYRAAGGQRAAAARLGVTQGTVSAQLARARHEEVDAVLGRVADMLLAIAQARPA